MFQAIACRQKYRFPPMQWLDILNHFLDIAGEEAETEETKVGNQRPVIRDAN